VLAGGVIVVLASAPAARAAPADPPATPPATPLTAGVEQLSHFDLEALRKWPRLDIVPDDADVQAMLRAGKPYVLATARMCIDRTGAPTAVELVERSGFPKYDAKLVATMRAWRYQPLVRDGEARAACGPVGFLYHPAIDFVAFEDCGCRAAFVGHQLFTSPTGPGVKVSYAGKQFDVGLATSDGERSIEGKPVRLLLSDYAGYDLKLWARPGDLAQVVRESTPLARTPDEHKRPRELKTPGVHLWAGAAVRVLARKQGLVQVRLLDDDRVLTGWLSASEVGLAHHGGIERMPGTSRRILLPDKTQVLDRPGGASLVELRADRGEAAVEVHEIERSGDDVLVEFQDRRWWVIGWVSAQQQVMHQPPRRPGPPVRRPGADKQPPRSRIDLRIDLPQGALVFDRPRGIAFGRVNRRKTAEVRRASGGQPVGQAGGQVAIDAVIGELTVDAWVTSPPAGGAR
jgi:hypothetical protein